MNQSPNSNDTPELVISTETPQARRWVLLNAASVAVIFLAIGISIWIFRDPGDKDALGVGGFIIAIGLISACTLLFGVGARGTWTFSAKAIVFEPRRRPAIRIDWTEVEKVQWMTGTVYGPGGRKIALPKTPANNSKDPRRAYEILIRELGGPFGYESWREKSAFVWTDPTTWFRWLADMIGLFILAGAIPAAVLLLLKYDLLNDRYTPEIVIGSVMFPAVFGLYRAHRLSRPRTRQ